MYMAKTPDERRPGFDGMATMRYNDYNEIEKYVKSM